MPSFHPSSFAAQHYEILYDLSQLALSVSSDGVADLADLCHGRTVFDGLRLRLSLPYPAGECGTEFECDMR